jgi:tRNA threonylcarbamoyladenosine biosynthesis protein TsaB
VKLLALETSGKRGSVAVLADGDLLLQRQLATDQRSARSLVPAIRACLADAGWAPGQTDLVAVTTGPGSFTGLRVGVVSAKTFAYAAGCEVIGVETLRAVAAQAPHAGSEVAVVIDAQRNQFYCGYFRVDPQGQVDAVRPASITDCDDWIAGLHPGMLVTGPGLSRAGLLDRLPEGVGIADTSTWLLQAATVGRLAWRDYQAGRRDDLWKLAPQYYRKSAAEEKWEQRQSQADS